MRPLKLNISAFGPYSDAVAIDMEQLGRNGIYLITGDTGAGKTTIFDAITYALYGRPSGENRDPSMLRSKYAKPETPTLVELVFSYGGKQYTVRRAPEYMRPARRGGGMTRQVQIAELELPDGRSITGASSVTREITEIMGIDRSQFTQIAMIAQGDFLKLLIAETAERREIFRKIFKTDYYRVLQERLGSESMRLRAQRERGAESVAQYISGISCPDDDELIDEVISAKNGEMTVEAAIELTENLVTRDSARIEVFTRELAQTEEQLAECERRLVQAAEKERISAQLTQVQERLAKQDEEVKKLEISHNEAKSHLPETEKLSQEIAVIEAELPQYDEAGQKREKLDISVKISEELTAGLEKKNAERSENAEKLERSRKELAELSKAGENRERLLAEKGRIRQNIADLEDLREKLTALKKSESELVNCQRELSSAERIRDDEQRTMEHLNAGISAIKLRQEELSAVGEEHARLRHEREAINKRQSEAAALKNDLHRYREACEELRYSQEVYRTAADNADDLNERYSAKYRLFLDGQAGVIAAGLRDGEPCPVCGAVHHPEPASAAENVPTEAELEKLKEHAESARADSAKRSEESQKKQGVVTAMAESLEAHLRELTGAGIDGAEARCQALIDRISAELQANAQRDTEVGVLLAERDKNAGLLTEREALLEVHKSSFAEAEKKVAELSGEAGLAEGRAAEQRKTALSAIASTLGEVEFSDAGEASAQQLKQAHADLEAIERAFSEENRRIARKTELERALPVLTERESALTAEISELTAKSAANEAERSGLRTQLAELAEKLRFGSPDRAREHIGMLETRIASMRNLIEQTRGDLEQAQRDMTELGGKAANLAEQLGGYSEIDGNTEKSRKEALEKKKSELSGSIRELHTRVTVNTGAIADIREKSADIAELDKRYTWVRALADTVNGSLSGKEKIMLETFVQTTYFDKIIARANGRLSIMTDGQYTLKRRITAENKQSQSGLELDVIDHVNGTERSVKSLSGGESFMASLALALGLSEEVQSSAGGIRLDTMFVDEGFGSLDENALQQAIKALTGLSDGSRLVGIISHVSELKERIERQIVVTKDRSGCSSVEIVV